MRRLCLGLILGVAACSGALPDRELDTATDPQVAAYYIAGVRTSPGTVHFTGLPWLLDSAEASGPFGRDTADETRGRFVVTTNVGTFVLPAITTTMTGVDRGAVSRAVGYNLSERHDIIAVSTATVPSLESIRLEAYGSFVETLWEVRDSASSALLGTGASFNPSGVYFQTVNAFHVPLPDTGLFAFAPGCQDLACDPLPGPEGEQDAGPVERRFPGFVPSPINQLINQIISVGGAVGEPGRR